MALSLRLGLPDDVNDARVDSDKSLWNANKGGSGGRLGDFLL